MKYDLAAMAKARGVKRKRVVFPPIGGTRAQSDELARLYLRTIAAWNAAIPEIVAAYERALASTANDSLTRDSASDVQRTIAGVDLEINRLILTLTPALRDWSLRIERFVRGKFASAALSAAGVNVDTMLGPEDARGTLDTWLARNVALVRDVSDQARGRISDAVFRGLTRRSPARDVAKSIREAVGLGRARSLRIASHQLGLLSSTLADERRRQAGIDKWQWLHSGKENGRPEHEALDGEIFSDDNPPEDMPQELPNCGCRQRAVLELD